MRDIRAELSERARLLQREIDAAQAHYDRLVAEAKQERDRKVAHLRAQIQALHRIEAMAEWHQSLKQGYAAAIAVLSAATDANQNTQQ